jgi:hypothetical protein
MVHVINRLCQTCRPRSFRSSTFYHFGVIPIHTCTTTRTVRLSPSSPSQAYKEIPFKLPKVEKKIFVSDDFFFSKPSIFRVMLFSRNGGRNRRKSECGDVKGAGQSGVQSECAGTTCSWRLVTSRVFDGCPPKSICDIKNTCEGIVLG